MPYRFHKTERLRYKCLLSRAQIEGRRFLGRCENDFLNGSLVPFEIPEMIDEEREHQETRHCAEDNSCDNYNVDQVRDDQGAALVRDPHVHRLVHVHFIS